MREYLGTVTRISVETFELTYQEKNREKHLTARLADSNPTKIPAVGVRVKIMGDWAGNCGAGALTTFTAREIEILN